MPKRSDEPNRHLKLKLDTDELYNAFQLIKKHRGIRNNTDVLRYLILKESNEIKKDLGEEGRFIKD